MPEPIVRKTIVLRGVNFQTARHDLTAEAKRTLSENLEMLRTEPNLAILIEGHTDNRGRDLYNEALSQRRATTVQQYFIKQGISASRTRVEAYGEARPEVPNTTPENMARNRRVVIQILEYPKN